jgi:hypothetical protein
MAVPESVDLSRYLRYIQAQPVGGGGCWGDTALMIWDIMNEMACPNSPNLSMKLWLNFFDRQDLWVKKDEICSPDWDDESLLHPIKYNCHKILTRTLPNGEVTNAVDNWLFQSFGNTTEGTEMAFGTCPYYGPYPYIDWTREGTLEAGNYKLKFPPHFVEERSPDCFIGLLARGYPISVGLGAPEGVGHVIGIVGYDKSSETFKYVNPWGDHWGIGGFATLTFEEVANRKLISFPFENWTIDDAFTYEIIPPKPVPVAKISFSAGTGVRRDVELWLSIEDRFGRPIFRRIWRREVDDACHKLSYTVCLPREFRWPPAGRNRIRLDLYNVCQILSDDKNAELTEFTAAFGVNTVKSSDLNLGPIKCKPGERITAYVP